MGLPEKYILTKTHCGSRSTMRWPLVESVRDFKTDCLALTGKPTIRNQGRTRGRRRRLLHKGTSVYDAGMVKKAVHLVRNPFDNVVARFHLYVKNQPKSFTNDPQGFRRWCHDLNQYAIHYMRKGPSSSGNVQDVISTVPCFSEFYRYVQWHNHASTVTQEIGVLPHFLHYEDYSHMFNETVEALLSYLDTPIIMPAPQFIPGKHYEDKYYSNEQRTAVEKLIKKIASRDTWAELERYFARADH